ncbi:hypothetical protein G4B88_011712 [Cannabis sativa]|uniref:Uncharacterized protein n=1 Tax=Cannabis sativa TaxID=3483 RepID=A0A7J6EY78_CANSA|nr:hypothetical protein G4B88_011712 [Cannabis sativa]
MDEEAEKRTGYDDYLFDIGKNHDSNTSINEGLNNCEDVYDDSGFTIDAAKYEDESIPHIIFFAAEKIQLLKS